MSDHKKSIRDAEIYSTLTGAHPLMRSLATALKSTIARAEKGEAERAAAIHSLDVLQAVHSETLQLYKATEAERDELRHTWDAALIAFRAMEAERDKWRELARDAYEIQFMARGVLAERDPWGSWHARFRELEGK